MANRVLDYLNVLQNYFGGIDYDQAAYEADDGISSTMQEGRARALAEIDDQLRDLKQLREDVRCMPLKKLQEKYDY